MNNIDVYFSKLKEKVESEYRIAKEARSLELDPVNRVEIPLAKNMASKCVNLIATIYPEIPVDKISNRILDLEDKYGKLDTTVAFIIAREISENKFFDFEDKIKAIDCGIRVAFSYITLGVVASPIEGYTGLEIKKTKDNKEYWCVNFSGPIRSAGTTASCVILMLIDYLREYFGYSKYDPTEEESKRYGVENTDYHERVTNLQYFPTEEEFDFLARNLPIEISGDPTEKREVSNYRDLSRINTNFIRGGMCLVFSEGLAQKAGKGINRLSSVKKNGLKCTGWDFLEEYLEIHKKREFRNNKVGATYISDLVAGRPVYGHPGRSGSFRLRYGRSRNSGFSAVSIHPATMGISGGFLSNGTQLKIEKPTKGCIITSCDSIEGPIVKLKNGSVKKIENFEEAKKFFNEIEEIVYLGDILFPLGDIIDRGADLLKPGYVEEWWESELIESGFDKNIKDFNFKESLELSEKYKIPLNPKYIFYWSQISIDDFNWLLDWLKNSTYKNNKLILPWNEKVKDKFKEGKRALEILGIEHKIEFDKIILNENSDYFLFNLGINSPESINFREYFSNIRIDGSVLETIDNICYFKIKDKAGSFIGARMGRPEKAKLRKLIGSPNGLFPISEEGGRLRSIQEACNSDGVKYNWQIYKCDCGNQTIYNKCEKCGFKTKKIDLDNNTFFKNRVDIKKYFEYSVNTLGYEQYEIPPLIKGVRDIANIDSTFENLSKAFLRAKFNLSVNKDGTIRYDGTEIPLTHFKPKEIGTSIEKLKELGYEKDIENKDLTDDNQTLELMPHDILISSCDESLDEKGDDVFLNISNFIDEELSRFYKLNKYYNLKNKDDLIGQLTVCMAPHNCAGVIGRIIGFSNLQGIIASPYMHAAIRRDCDGDEMAVMLLMDVLLNFSRKFLPSHRGGTQDAPLVLNTRIEAGEVDDQILNFEMCKKYPLEIYRLAEIEVNSTECIIDNVKKRLKNNIDVFKNIGFTHDTNNINDGFVNGVYKTLPTMKEKVNRQMELVEKIRAVDTNDVARLIIERHFIRDIRGNLRKFFRQRFRCSGCNKKYRRPPLFGQCTCGGKLIFTISEGSIKKYLPMALSLSEKYKIPEYTKESLILTDYYIKSIFGKNDDKQVELKDF